MDPLLRKMLLAAGGVAVGLVGLVMLLPTPEPGAGAAGTSAVRSDAAAEPSSDILSRVLVARERQGGRGARANAQLTPKQVRHHCRIDDASRARLEEAVRRMGLSARAYTRVLKVARTIADLAGRPRILQEDVSEALRYRALDRAYWTG